MKTFTFKPLAGESDVTGYINTTTIAAWFESARTQYLQSLVGHASRQPDACMLASVRMDHLAACFAELDVSVEISATSQIGNTSFQLGCRMYQDGVLKVVGKAVMVCIARDNWQPRPISNVLRKLLQHEVLSFQRMQPQDASPLQAAMDS